MRPTLVTHQQARLAMHEEAWGTLAWMADAANAGLDGLTLGRVTLNPRCTNPRHSHPNCDEVLHVISGEIEHSIGVETVFLRAGDTLVIPAGMPHQARNVGSGVADTIVVYSTGRREFKQEPGGW